MRSVAVTKNLLLFDNIFVHLWYLSLTYVYIIKIHPASDRDESCVCVRLRLMRTLASLDLIRLESQQVSP